MRNICDVEGCGEYVAGRGLCSKHYYRLRRTGSLADPTPEPIGERFWRQVDKAGDDECWLWSKGVHLGYGQFWVKELNRSMTAHRWVYENEVGPIPEGMVIDHKCHTEALAKGLCDGGECIHRRCVNPRHLSPENRGVNSNFGNGPAAKNARKTHCKNGHEFTPENTRMTTRGFRVCRACERAHQDAWAQTEAGKESRRKSQQKQNARRKAERAAKRQVP